MTRSKRVLIMTQGLGCNYGGMLQAYALQRYVRSLGFEVLTNNHFQYTSITRRMLRIIKGKLLGRSLSFIMGADERNVRTTHTRDFISRHIRTVDIYRGQSVKKSLADVFDVFIVGSDQVWRKDYSCIPDNLLGFTGGRSVRRLAYAASFGTDNIDNYGDSLLRKSAKLAKQFDAISVRERSGVDICKNQWGVEAVHVLDPTFLFDKKCYAELIDDDVTYSRGRDLVDGGVFCYLLDPSDGKRGVAKRVASTLGGERFELTPSIPHDQTEFSKDPKRFVLPPVSQWLDGFNKAGFVVTDSFHGVVFSVIFNKPFIVVGNKERGLARFSSLLKQFQLEDRLVSSSAEVTEELICQEIDWRLVDEVLAKEQKKSLAFLRATLL